MNQLTRSLFIIDYRCFIFFTFAIFINIQSLIDSKAEGVGYFDEVILIFWLFIYVLKRFLNNSFTVIDSLLLSPILSIFFTLLVIVLNTEVMVSWGNVIAQSFISFKFFLFVPLFFYMNEKGVDFRIFIKPLFLFTVVGTLINIIFPEFFINEKTEGFVDREFRLVGFQFKPNDMAVLTSFCFGFFLNHKNLFIKSYTRHLYIFIALAIIFLSTSRTGIFVCAIFIFAHVHKRYGIKSYPIFLLLSFGLLQYFSESFIVSQTVKNFTEFNNIHDSSYIRFIMVYYSGLIAVDYFPLGSGAATFGTVLSQESFIYEKYGLGSLEFFADFWGVFDSNLASILGEYGVFSVLFIYFIVYKVVVYRSKNKFLFRYLFIIFVFISIFQPILSYHINSINFLILLMAFKAASSENNKTRIL